MRGCMTELAKPADALRTLFVTVLMIASELLTLNISKVGNTVNRFILNDFDTFKSSWLIRSRKKAFQGVRGTFSELGVVGEPRNAVGRITCPAGHGALQFAGYKVVP